MEQEEKLLLLKLLTILMDSELAAAEQLHPWVLQAPSLKDRIEIGEVMAEELGHGGAVAKVLLEEFKEGGERCVNDVVPRRIGQHFLDPFNQRFTCWEETAVYTALMDGSALYIIGNYLSSSFLPFRNLAKFLLKEEVDHINFGFSRIGNCYQSNPKPMVRLLKKWLPLALGNFGSRDSQYDRLKLKYGITRRSNEDTRKSYLMMVTKRFKEVHIPLPK